MNLLILALFFVPHLLSGQVHVFHSGMLARFESENPGARSEESEAVSHFLEENFGRYRPDFEWRRVSLFRDNTHSHYNFNLYYKGFRVLDQTLHLDYNREGFVQYATSSWRKPFQTPLGALQESSRWMIESSFKAPFVARNGFFAGQVDSEPSVWLDEKSGEVSAVYQVRFFPYNTPRGMRVLIADASSGRVLAERVVARNVSVDSKAWKVSPLTSGGDIDKSPDDVSLVGLEQSSGVPILKNGYFRVRRVGNSVASPKLIDINPDAATAFTGFSAQPGNSYDYTCPDLSETGCPNQRIDGANAYYQLYNFRTKLQGYFTTMGVDVPMVVPTATTGSTTREPLEVYINGFPLASDADHDTNNAAFYPYGCPDIVSTEGVHTEVPRCLFFLRPAPVTSAECGSNKDFYDLAREAMVIVHEYQHFVTDSIVDLTPGSIDTTTGVTLHNVGDAIHEGYSDYFGASIVSELAGTSVTKIGEYAFKNCTFYQRDVAIPRVYTNGSSEEDAHIAGLTWASGLWQLRTELDAETVDLLTLKSIFFLSAKVGFTESVEALVKADKALNGGENVARIRELFYNDLKWVGGKGNFLRDPEKGIAEVGFRSCSAVPMPGSAAPTFGSIVIWLMALVGAGRRSWWRKGTRP